jgi:hypothetical protein
MTEMTEEKNLNTDEFSSEEKELLDLARKLREGGMNPATILKYFLEIQEAVKKTATVGKQTQDFLMKKFEDLEKVFKEGKKP